MRRRGCPHLPHAVLAGATHVPSAATHMRSIWKCVIVRHEVVSRELDSVLNVGTFTPWVLELRRVLLDPFLVEMTGRIGLA